MNTTELEANPQDPTLAFKALHSIGRSAMADRSIETFRENPYLRKWLYEVIELETLQTAIKELAVLCMVYSLAHKNGYPYPDQAWDDVYAIRMALMRAALSHENWWLKICETHDWSIVSGAKKPQ